MSAIALDLRHPEVVALQLAEAAKALEGTRTTPPAVVGLVEELTAAIGAGAGGEVSAVNPWQWIAVQGAALRAQGALRHEDPRRRSELRLALEQLRFLLSRIADRREVGEDRPADEIAQWLEETLPSVPQGAVAGLLGISLRTYQRRLAGGGRAGGSAASQRRLRVVARIVNQLRHGLTGPGVVEWFEHPRPDLGGDRPLDVLEDPERLEELLAAAAASRGNVAA